MPFVENNTEDYLVPPTMLENSNGQRPLNVNNAPVLLGSTHYEPNPDIRNIMVTGAAGFIGSWITRHLTLTYQANYNIVAFDKLDYCASLNNTSQLEAQHNFAFYKGDITSSKDVMGCLRKHNIDTVLHFAAQSHVDLSFGNSYQFTLTNVFGTHVLLECMKTHGIRRFIHVSTDEVYGEIKDGEDDLLEESLLAPTNPYAASKAAAEMLVNAYFKSFQLPVIMVRSNNIYGPHQFPEKVIPKFILLLQRQRKLTLHGSGKNTRRYLYAGDAADAFDTVLHRGEIGHIYNVGSRDEISNLALCEKLLGHFGPPDVTMKDFGQYVTYTEDRPFNDHRYAVDGSKLKRLGWVQKTCFEDGLRMTIDWYREYGAQWWGDIDSRLTPFPIIPKPDIAKTGVEVQHKVVAHTTAKYTKEGAGVEEKIQPKKIQPKSLKRRREEEEPVVMGADMSVC